MPRVTEQFIIDRPIEAVFEFVTTARYWPQWHPAALLLLLPMEAGVPVPVTGAGGGRSGRSPPATGRPW
jgi:hypothetical protein